MPPRVRDLLALAELGLRLRAGSGGLDRPVRWVATSELEDPGAYLEGGELLLSTGMRLEPQNPHAVQAYVQRLVTADVAALGFGVGPVHSETPPALVAATEDAGLPLLEVPLPVPFIAVSKAVSRLLAAEEYEHAARGFAAQRDLIRAAVGSDDAPAALLPRLARHLGGFALLLDPHGTVLFAQPATAAVRAGELQEEVARLRPRGLLASAVVATSSDYVVLHPLGVHGRTRGFLVAGSAGPLLAGEQAVVNLAVSLLSLWLARDPGGADRSVRRAALALLLEGWAHRLPLAELGWWALDGPVQAVLVRVTPGAGDAAERVREVLPGAAVSDGVVPDPDLVVAVVAARTDLAELRTLVAADEALVGAGVGDVAALEDRESLARSLAQARRAATRAVRTVRSYDELGSGLDGLLEAGAADAWAAALLAALDAPTERADLAGTLRAWLARHGQVDAAAGDLGVHRHTVRHRLRRAEALLGRSLDDPGVRAELYLALSRRPTGITGSEP